MVPCGHLLHIATETMAHLWMIYLLDLIIFHSYARLPEGAMIRFRCLCATKKMG